MQDVYSVICPRECLSAVDLDLGGRLFIHLQPPLPNQCDSMMACKYAMSRHLPPSSSSLCPSLPRNDDASGPPERRCALSDPFRSTLSDMRWPPSR
jgi:hypothetical protein